MSHLIKKRTTLLSLKSVRPFPIPSDMKQGDALSPLLFYVVYKVPLGRSKKRKREGNRIGHFSAF
jgi:hypothetical protein